MTTEFTRLLPFNTEIFQQIKVLTEARFNDSYTPRPPQNLLYVPMGFAEITSADSDKPVIGTSSLASCLGIAIYDAQRKVGGVAHVFFNEKTSYTDYLTDSRGYQIASSGREIVVDNPIWYKEAEYVLSDLISILGNGTINLTFFNAHHGARTTLQNETLVNFLSLLSSRLITEGHIVSVNHLTYQEFTLDTRDGRLSCSCPI